MIGFYIKSAVHSIRRRRTFSLLNVTGLAIGMSVFLLTLEYYSFETGFNRFHKNLPNLYRITTFSQRGSLGTTVPNIAPMMAKNIPGVMQTVRIADNFNSGAILSYQPTGNSADRKSFRDEECIFTDPSFLNIFSFPLLEGSNQLDKPHTVVITHSVAKKIFGEESPLGKTLELHNQFGILPCTVTGVLKDIPAQSDIRFSCLFPIETLNNAGYTAGSDWARLDTWGNDSYSNYVLISDPLKAGAIAAQASGLLVKNDPLYKKEDGIIRLQPVGEMHLGRSLNDDAPVFGSRLSVYFIFGLGMLVLFIAWINYINFSTAFALSQAKNIGIHKIIGSDKKQIVLRYLTESLLIHLASLFLAYFILTITQGLFNYVTARDLSLYYINRGGLWLGGTAILSAGILLCGGYVGWVLARFKPAAALRYNDHAQFGNNLLRRGLVIFQFTVSIIFISSTIIAFQQLQFMKKHDLGMNIDHLVVIDGPGIKGTDSIYKSNKTYFRNELAKLPFIQKISLTGSVPGLGYAHNFNVQGIMKQNAPKGDENKSYAISIVDENYFDTYGIHFLNGRNFSPADISMGFSAGRVIVNETAARELGFDPGKAFSQTVNWGKSYEIIGVIKDYNHRSLKEKIEPIIYIPQNNNACYSIKMNLADLKPKMARIRDLYEKAYPGNPFSYHILKEVYDAQYSDEQKAGVIALCISVLVVLIACLGLIGLSIFTAKRRKKEIGVRKILGASVASLFALLSKDFLMLVGISFLIATPIAWIGMNQWLLNFAYHSSLNFSVFLIAGVVAVIIALITISFQSFNAARINPVKSLRSE